MIESLYVNLQRGESRQNFSIWVYGDQRLARGSGLFVPFEGIACNHHFLLPDDGSEFHFLPGEYTLRVFAKRVESDRTIELAKVCVSISQHHSQQLRSDNAGIYFDWGPDQRSYHAHVDDRPPELPPDLLKAFERVVELG